MIPVLSHSTWSTLMALLGSLAHRQSGSASECKEKARGNSLVVPLPLCPVSSPVLQGFPSQREPRELPGWARSGGEGAKGLEITFLAERTPSMPSSSIFPGSRTSSVIPWNSGKSPFPCAGGAHCLPPLTWLRELPGARRPLWCPLRDTLRDSGQLPKYFFLRVSLCKPGMRFICAQRWFKFNGTCRALS